MSHTVLIQRPGEDLVREEWARIDHIQINRAIGSDCFDICFVTSSPIRGRRIVGYCDDEGRLKGLPINFHRPRDGAPIAGPVVVLAAVRDEEDGLEPVEAAFVREFFAAVLGTLGSDHGHRNET